VRPFNRSGYTHAARDIHTENNRYILRLSLLLFVNDLSGSFKDIVNTLGLWHLLWLQLHRILGEAELTVPHLCSHSVSNLAILIKYGLALGAKHRVTCGHLTRILQTAKFDQKHVGIDLLLILCLLLFRE
jgi:hypothetical protein